MKRRHGRKNQPLEYIEFTAISPNGVKRYFFTQQYGNQWFAYEMDAGRNGAIRLYANSFRSMANGEKAVCKAAERFESGKSLK